MSEKHTPQSGSFVKYAGAAYEVVDVVDHLGCLFVRIYDEPPSRHIDEIKLSSVEIINVPELLSQVAALTEENERLLELSGNTAKANLEIAERFARLEELLLQCMQENTNQLSIELLNEIKSFLSSKEQGEY